MSSKADIDDPTIPLVFIEGLPFPGPPFVPDICKEVLKFKPNTGDIFIVTYPKCGTTWMQYIVWEILNGGIPPPSPNQMMFKSIPFLEGTGLEALKELTSPRAMKTHLPFNLNPYSPSAKYIYVVRNPWDACVSYYHHSLNDPSMKKSDRSFDDFFEYFIRGQVPWGDFIDHALSWYNHKDDPNVLFVTFEDMKKDPRQTLFTVAEFLGKNYLESLAVDEQLVENCLKYSNFKYLKEMGFYFINTDEKQNKQETMASLSEVDSKSVDPSRFKRVDFFRKGVVGDYKNYFTAEQKRRFSVYLKNKLKGTAMEDFWSSQMGSPRWENLRTKEQRKIIN